MNTTIAVTKQTKERLKELGAKGETYDEIISRVSSMYEEFINRQYKKLGEKGKFKKMTF